MQVPTIAVQAAVAWEGRGMWRLATSQEMYELVSVCDCGPLKQTSASDDEVKPGGSRRVRARE
jgi:hypothetical protein